jgi:acyl-CoA thioesterase-1
MQDGVKMRKFAAIVLSVIVLTGTLLCSQDAFAQVVAFGHSAVDGRVSKSEMWPAVLEDMLRAKGSSTQVINAGVYGETTWDALTRVHSAIPEGTKLVILVLNGFNDARAVSRGRTDHSANEAPKNISAIKAYLQSRGIKVIDAWQTYASVSRKPGVLLSDGLHLNVEGNRDMAKAMLSQVR